MSTQTDVTPESPAHDSPEALQFSSIAPGMTVGDLDASLSWYCDVVGFTVEREFEHEGEVRGAALAAGAVRVMISRDDWAHGKDRIKGVAHRLYLTTDQDVDEIAAGIKARGGSLASEPMDMPWGARAFNLVDPDGFQLTVSSGM